MSKKLAKKFCTDVRKTLKFRSSQKSFSIPKKIWHKRSPIRNIQNRIIKQETDYEESYSNNEEYSSIETARSACNTSNNFYLNSSCDILVHYKSVVSKDFSSDPCEFFHQNQPIAASTPKNHSQAFSSHLIKNYDQFSSFIKPIQCSTPIKKPPPHHLYEDYEKMKSFMDFTSQESTIIEPASISLVLPAEQDNQEDIIPEMSGINEMLFLDTSILKIAELSECDRDALNACDTICINSVVNNKDSKLKTKDVRNAFQESIATEKDPTCNTFSKKNKKQVNRAKRLQNIPVCVLTLLPKHPKSVIQHSRSVKDNPGSIHPDIAEFPEHKDALKAEIYKYISICPLALPPKHLIPVIQQRRSKIKRNKKISRVMKWGKN